MSEKNKEQDPSERLEILSGVIHKSARKLNDILLLWCSENKPDSEILLEILRRTKLIRNDLMVELIEFD